jgi:hypothetical protein
MMLWELTTREKALSDDTMDGTRNIYYLCPSPSIRFETSAYYLQCVLGMRALVTKCLGRNGGFTENYKSYGAAE